MSSESRTAEIAGLVKRARALVFDFDGTLVRSNEIKWRAFELCFGDFPERLDEILAYCRSRHHISRGVKFRHVYEGILGLAYTPEVDARLHARFEAASTRQIVAAPPVPGAERFLAATRPGRATALLSSTPQEVLARIVVDRGWRRYFDEIRGAPIEKAAWLREYRARAMLGGDDVVMFGDTEEDAAAAVAAGCAFVAVGCDTGGHAVRDFDELMRGWECRDASRR